jgi:hypothetical protein
VFLVGTFDDKTSAAMLFTLIPYPRTTYGNEAHESGESVMSESKSSTAAARKTSRAGSIESVADIIERELQPLIANWLDRVEGEPDLARIPLNYEERTGHLPHLLHDVIARLRLDAGAKAPISQAAADHGDLRRKQGYTVAMAVEESRLLQVSIFSMLHKNVKNLEFSTLLPDVVTIADEVDAQLKEQMLRFMAADAAAQKNETPPTHARID